MKISFTLLLGLVFTSLSYANECRTTLLDKTIAVAEMAPVLTYFYLPYALTDSQVRKMAKPVFAPIIDAALRYNTKCLKQNALKKCDSLALLIQRYDLKRLDHDSKTQVPGEIGTFEFISEANRKIYMTWNEIEKVNEEFEMNKELFVVECVK